MTQSPEQATTYTGPTDPYGAPQSTFPGPYVTGAMICGLGNVELTPLGPVGPRRSATVLFVQRHEGWPALLRATVDGPAGRWAVHPDAHPQLVLTYAIAAALTAAGVPITMGHRVHSAVVELPPADGEQRWLTITHIWDMVWALESLRGTLASGRWPSSDPADAPSFVRTWLVENDARARRRKE